MKISMAAWAATLSMTVAVPMSAQSSQPTGLAGIAESRAAGQLDYERALRDAVDRDRIRTIARTLAAEPHVAGTPQQRQTAFWVDSVARSWGLETKIDSYLVYLPFPTRVELWRDDGAGFTLLDVSKPDESDPSGGSVPVFSAYTGAGDATGDLVYVNYGLIEDYRMLDSLDVSVDGKVVIARYGRSFRGIKAREAERHGARALLLFSDPADDGFVRGDPFPEGPYRPSDAVQRGSVLNSVGDPSTPGEPSDFGTERLDPTEMQGISRIPVVPISYGVAQELLRDLAGGELPRQDWQGGLPFRYHVGPGPVRLRVRVDLEPTQASYRPIYNTLAWIPGARYPDEWVILGAHRDAWGAGAIDNVSGTVSVLAAAHAFATEVWGGRRPDRTVMFATWDAEEWGLIGSTEFVERHEDELAGKVVAYINQDAAAWGRRFNAAASGSLKQLLLDISHTIPNPFGPGTLWQMWREGQDRPETTAPRVGDLGGGSDYAGFYNHLGIAAANLGFSGTGGVYHSAYDNTEFMESFGDPGYRAHAGIAGTVSTLAARLANADILPYDHVGFSEQLIALSELLDGMLAGKGWEVNTQDLHSAFLDMRAAASELESARASALSNGWRQDYSSVNRELMRVDQAFTRDSGIGGRRWYRNLIFAADRDNGYANTPFPAVSEAIRDGDTKLTQDEIDTLTGLVRRTTTLFREITGLIARTE